MRGFFEIGIYRGKTATNVGTLWRSASQLGASGIFVVGARYPKQASDTAKVWKHVPMRSYRDLADLKDHLPDDCRLGTAL